MIGKGPDRKSRPGPFREYRTCVLGAQRACALSTYVFSYINANVRPLSV
ncbi:unnamed protein product [Staurois parvus]|uniref:Uncharacterized protein n=1 Tax=Staurois parvus TaxID=386267 RepID=A0ABN9HNR3_9NEOB|nr:unnamed protein product [Staurois parvus]